MEIMLTLPVLQRRCATAAKHVKKYLNRLKEHFVKEYPEALSISSYNSTLPSERERYENRTARDHLLAFASRDDIADLRPGPAIETRLELRRERKRLGEELPPAAPYVRHPRTPGILAPQTVIHR